jgi:hypothetical protein
MSSDVNLAAQPVVMQLGGGPLAYLRKIGAVCAKDPGVAGRSVQHDDRV